MGVMKCTETLLHIQMLSYELNYYEIRFYEKLCFFILTYVEKLTQVF